MPRGNKGRTGMRKTTHKTPRHSRGKSNRKTRKNRTRTTTPRITTPFDLESELRNQERRETMQELPTNPFGRTANLRYGIDTANVSGKEISRLASRLQKKRDRRRTKRKDELTEQERRLREKTRNNFLEEIMKLKPQMWNEQAWRREAEISTNPGLSSPTRKNLLKEIDLMPITEVIITEVEDEEDEPSLNLSKASLFSRRKSMKSRIAEGNKKKKRKRKRRVTKKRKRKRKRKKR